MQSSAQEVTILFELIAAAKDSWACLFPQKSLYFSCEVRPAWRECRIIVKVYIEQAQESLAAAMSLDSIVTSWADDCIEATDL